MRSTCGAARRANLDGAPGPQLTPYDLQHAATLDGSIVWRFDVGFGIN